ncbi:unnamed protein product, partial [Discosporangium mesarthrocarpum]
PCFPLYTKALDYICHADFHVRIAALTVILNIYNQPDPLVRAFLAQGEARSALLERLVGALRSQCLIMADRVMMMAGNDPGFCKDSIAGLQDQVFYLQDVFTSGQQELNTQLCNALMERFVRPLLLRDWLTGGKLGPMFPQVALCALAQLFIIIMDPPLVRLLARETLGKPSTRVAQAPVLQMLQSKREELCMGALIVLQALSENQVVRSDLGLMPSMGIGDGRHHHHSTTPALVTQRGVGTNHNWQARHPMSHVPL